MSQRALDLLRQRHEAAIIDSGSHVGDEMALVHRENLLEVMQTLKNDPELAFEMLSDLTVVDYLGQSPRFEVVYQLYSLTHRHRLRIKVPVLDDSPEQCWVDSCTDLWRSADWSEREAWDMYGVAFRGHPDLRRILLYEEFEGHPLRRDYPANARQPLVRRPDAPATDDQTTRLAAHSHDRRVE